MERERSLSFVVSALGRFYNVHSVELMRVHVVVYLATGLFVPVTGEDVYCHKTSKYKLCATVSSAKNQHLLNFKAKPFSKGPKIRFATGDLPFVYQRDNGCWIPRGPVTDAHEEMFSGVREITKLPWMVLKNIKVCPRRDGMLIIDAAKRSRRVFLTNIRSTAEEKRRLEDAFRPLPANRKRKRPGGAGITEPRPLERGGDALSSGHRESFSRGMPSGHFCNAEPVGGLTKLLVTLSNDGETVNASLLFFGDKPLAAVGMKRVHVISSLPLSSSSLVPGRPGLSLWSVERGLADSAHIESTEKILEAVGKEASIPLLDTKNLHILSDENSGSIGDFFGSSDVLGTPALWVPLARTACRIVDHNF
ncbi:hypothetical protein FOZ60_008634 [Perkinsus olseni]|uniref:Uncharacterized protein n=1 Tax=Perkinsus olseni TaxID=32597 RepID=A0A7J6NIX8_PEROL|nr:hypothetical protein FOZ60_008634 [Perkinsus olseni]